MKTFYAEPKNVSAGLKSIEKTFIMMLLKEEISEEELKEIEEAEIERGNPLPLRN
ncbi:MAG: hypothetical protein QW506_05630 [Thermoproteota archaeon]|nr:hypothetical protein [Candidatus Brockarchaeota archaeon]